MGHLLQSRSNSAFWVPEEHRLLSILGVGWLAPTFRKGGLKSTKLLSILGVGKGGLPPPLTAIPNGGGKPPLPTPRMPSSLVFLSGQAKADSRGHRSKYLHDDQHLM